MVRNTGAWSSTCAATLESSQRKRRTAMSRYLVGIDLGTTHSVVAYVDSAEARPEIKVFGIEQLVAPGEVAARPLLPSVRYHPVSGELAEEDPAKKTEDNADQKTVGDESGINMLTLLFSGGHLMWPIVAMSLLVVTFGVERALALRRRKIILGSRLSDCRGSLCRERASAYNQPSRHIGGSGGRWDDCSRWPTSISLRQA